MSNQRLLKSGASIDALTQLLMKCPEVTKYNADEHSEPETIALAFSDIEESFHVFLENHLPKLVSSELEPCEIRNLLLDIGEEFRHILYHIHDPRFYEYLCDNIDRKMK